MSVPISTGIFYCSPALLHWDTIKTTNTLIFGGKERYFNLEEKNIKKRTLAQFTESKISLDSGFHAVDSGFQILCQWNLGRDPFNQNSNRSDREKRTTSKGGPVFPKLFRLDRTDPLSFGPKFPEILVEQIAPLDSEFQMLVVFRIPCAAFGFQSPGFWIPQAKFPRFWKRDSLT